MNIAEKTILITGGGSGIGLAIAKELLKNNNKVIACGRNLSKLEKVKEQMPELEIAKCDITDNDQIKGLAANCIEKFGGLDILINNAGVFQSIDMTNESVSLEDQLREIDIDFSGPIRMIHFFMPQLRQKDKAAIVNVSSALAFVPFAQAPIYCGTKAGVHSWTRSLRYQLRKTNISVFELLPPLVETDMVADFEGQKMMKPEKLASAFVAGLENDVFEITPGQSKQLRIMSRFAPKFIFRQLNKQFN